MTRFLKMHGCGNDFVVFDERAGLLGLTPRRAAAIADRRTGVGCDQFIAVEPPPPDSNADAFMRIRNPDGAEAGACGNATRCVAAILAGETGRHTQVIPLARPMDTLHLDLAPGPLADPAAASMGNPHATFFVADVARLPVAELGPRLEQDPLFPERANISFAEILAPDRIRLRVWERGAGLTRACGSGACAALVNAHRRGLTGRRATLVMDGGELEIEWREDGHVLMTGPVATSFIGEIDLAAYPA
jgi:diaminopimelate epimerase